MVRVLFVCTGNTCRSPMAEAILRDRGLKSVEVRSAGVYAMDGQAASAHAQSVLRENEIAQEHRSSLLTAQQVEWATHILSMTESHKHAIVRQFPEAEVKTFTLKEFAGIQLGRDVLDPYGGPIEIYRETFREINDSIEKMLERLERELD